MKRCRSTLPGRSASQGDDRDSRGNHHRGSQSSAADRLGGTAVPAQIELRPTASLTPHARNARAHSDRQLAQLAASIRTFGFTIPVLVNSTGTILAGHARVEAAKRAGLLQVPVLTVEHLTEAQQRAYVIADNRLAELATWDRETLTIELKDLVALDFDVETTGFATGEIDILFDGAEPTPDRDQADDLPEAPAGPAVSRLGDLWHLGRHRLLCGDALQRASYRQLLGDEKTQMVFSDPPYNVPVDGHARGLGKVIHREFVMASGEMSEDEFADFLRSAIDNHIAHCVDGAIAYICMDWSHLETLLATGRRLHLQLKNLVVWAKTNAGMGSFYRSQHELIAVFKSGRHPHVNNFGLGDKGRYRTNVWSYPGVNTMKAGRAQELAMHPTVKPVALVADAIRDCSKRNGLILDGFAGSGTTIIAAERTGRIARAIELDPLYVDVAVRRFEAFTGTPARLAGTGRTFAEIARERCEWPTADDEKAPPAKPRGRKPSKRGAR